MRERAGLINPYETPFIPFPEKPELITLDDLPVYKYITPKEFTSQLEKFAACLDFSQFDTVAFNLNGGKFPALLLSKLKVRGYNGYYPIEYHMAREGKPVSVDQSIPEFMKNDRILVIEDVYDSGLSFQRMLKDCPGLFMVVMSLKTGVPNQVKPNDRVIPLFKTVPEWQAGAGMNIDYDNDPHYPRNSFRNYPGIVVRPPDDVLLNYKRDKLLRT